ASGALQVGVTAPPFELKDHNGQTVSSAALLQTGPLVICFFRGRWCPFCVAQLEAMNQVLPEIRRVETNLVAISPQTTHQSFLMADQHRLVFPLLSYAGGEVARQFGVSYHVPDDQQAIYRRTFTNLAFLNGDERWELPMPAVFVITRDNKIRY